MEPSAAAATIPPLNLPRDAVDFAYDLAASAMEPDKDVKPHQVGAYNNAQLDAHEEHLVALINESDMPDAMKEEALAMIARVIDSYRVPNVDPSIEAEVTELHGAEIQEAVDDFWELMMEQVNDQHDDDSGGAASTTDSGGGSEGAGGAGPGNWLVKLAQRMAEVQIHYAEKLEAASDRMAEATEGELVYDEAKHAAGKGPSEADVNTHNKDQRADFIRANAEFTAYSRLFSMASESTSNAVKSIGEGLTSIARKQ